MLTGLVKCAECGCNFIVNKHRSSTQKIYYYYRCAFHNRRGNAVCTNKTGLRRDHLEGAVMDLLQREILTKEMVQTFVKDIRKAWKAQRQEGPEKELKRVQNELRKVERELTNLVQAIKKAGISEALSNELERCEKHKARLEQTQSELQQMEPQRLSMPTEQDILQALEGFRGMLENGTPQEKKLLLEAHIEEIQVKPNGETLLKANPAGLLPLPDYPSDWCRRWGSNPHEV